MKIYRKKIKENRKIVERDDRKYYLDTRYWGEIEVLPEEVIEKILDKINLDKVVDQVEKEQGFDWDTNDYSLEVGAWLDITTGKVITGHTTSGTQSVGDYIHIPLFLISPRWDEIYDDEILGGNSKVYVNYEEFVDFLNEFNLDIEDYEDKFDIITNGKEFEIYFNVFNKIDDITCRDWLDSWSFYKNKHIPSYDEAWDEVIEYYIDRAKDWVEIPDLIDYYEDVYYYDENGEKEYIYK
jgi:hypothetical protein